MHTFGVQEWWPLVGRDDELQLIGEILGRAPLVLSGGAGVGKTRLLHETLRLAEGRGWATARAFASKAASSIPFGALAPLVPPEELRGASRLEILRLAANAIGRRGKGDRVLLAVDDAHDLDDASATLVHQLATDGAVAIVITVRTGELTPDAVTLLWKDGPGTRLEVQALSRSEVEQLAEAALRGPTDGALLQQLWTASQGNPLYVRELLLNATTSGALALSDGVWRLVAPLELPPHLVELVDLRLGGLGRPEREVIDLLAAADSLGLSTIEALFGSRPIEQLEVTGLIRVVADDRRLPVRLSHPLYGEVVRAGTGAARMRALERSIAALIERSGARRQGDVIRIAMLRLNADGTADPALLADAARDAYYTYDLALAERLASAAVRCGAPTPTRRLLAEILRFEGRHGEAEHVLAAIDIAALEDEEERALVALTRAENLFRGLGRLEDADRLLDDADSLIADPAWRAEIASLRATFEMFLGRVTDALARVEPILRDESVRAFVSASVVAATALPVHGRALDAIPLAERAFEAVSALGHQPMLSDPGVFVAARCLALAYAGRLPEADAMAQTGYEWAVASGILLGQVWFAMILGRIALERGSLARAERVLREGAAGFRDVHETGLRRWCLAGVAQASAARGDVDGAREALRALDDEPRTLMRLMDAEVERARAGLAAAQGDLGTAHVVLLGAAAVARGLGQYGLEAAVLHDAARLGIASSVLARMEEVGQIVQGQLMVERVAHVRALAARDAGALERSSLAFEALDALLLAAETAAQAASAYRDAGRARLATACAGRAHVLAGRCDGARTPALADADLPARLTGREREIAGLAAGGMSNRQIAARLVLSERTVENHLQHVYVKLGVSGRVELAARLQHGQAQS